MLDGVHQHIRLLPRHGRSIEAVGPPSASPEKYKGESIEGPRDRDGHRHVTSTLDAEFETLCTMFGKRGQRQTKRAGKSQRMAGSTKDAQDVMMMHLSCYTTHGYSVARTRKTIGSIGRSHAVGSFWAILLGSHTGRCE